MFIILSQEAELIKDVAFQPSSCYPFLILKQKGGHAMHEDRRFLRALLSALIAERADAEGLYIPRGEEGMRRMIRALLDMRAPRDDDPLLDMIRCFRESMQ